MTGFSQASLAVTEVSQVGQARRAAVRAAESTGLTEEARGEVAIIATELANNLVRYGKDGRFFVQPMQQPGWTCVQMLAVDSGPGIADLQRSMQDGVSTGGTPGTGLGAVRRLSDDFDIYSARRAGNAGAVARRRPQQNSAGARVRVVGDFHASAARDRVRRRLAHCRARR